MPEAARVLPFAPRQRRQNLSAASAIEAASEYLKSLREGRSPESIFVDLRQPEIIFAVINLLKELLETAPAEVCEAAADLFNRVQRSSEPLGLFDEKDYVCGELARFAGAACRAIGEYEKAERWFDRADAAYQNTINPGPLLASVAYARLAVRYETHRYDEILDLIPDLLRTFAKLGMSAEAFKTRFVHALTLRAAGRGEDAFQAFLTLCADLEDSPERSLFGQVLVHLGDYTASLGEFDQAQAYYQRAVPVIAAHGRATAVAELKWSIGSTYRAQGRLKAALEAYRAARADYHQLGHANFESFVGLAIADTLLSLGKPREAEWEILAALPAIAKADLGAEVAAAVALLQETARQRRADPRALSDLRERLSSSYR
ncbi:MAG: tetratricopeptide repeat protein [Thermoanaerobaculia bacterium]